MKSILKAFAISGLMSMILGIGTDLHATTQYLVSTNDDVIGPNTVTIYQASGTPLIPRLVQLRTIKTGGVGAGGGYFGIVRQVLVKSGNEECIFASDGGSNDVAGIINGQSVTGTFKGSTNDTDGSGGMGLALSPNGRYLYAAFSGSSTIATFTISSGCTLTFVSDVSAAGLNAGFPHGMKTNGNILVVAYGDGSIESFDIASGAPVSNNDLQLSTGYQEDFVFPDGVDVTEDGHYAIFGDASGGFSEVEVSDISSGKLGPTIKYGGSDRSLGGGRAANNVWLSPDESLLYISDNLSGQVTAATFDKTAGTLRFACISSPLRGFQTSWSFSSAIAVAGTTGDGSVLWVAEDPQDAGTSSIGIINVNVHGESCTLKESANSPASDQNSLNLSWLNGFPGRSF